ncbi:MAG: ABC transporter permease [Actinomycetota bacterium]|nr:ABC transporter permease [Actinomycetota bacterium]
MSTTTMDKPLGRGGGPESGTEAGFAEGRQVPLSRLVKVELRKMVDTRAGLWLVVTMAAISAIVMVIMFATSQASDRTFLNFMAIMATPQAILLPILGILLVTQEWGQRTGMVTFTLTPHRGRVMSAKVVAALLLGFAALGVCLVIATAAALVGGSSQAWTGIGADDIGKFAILEVSSVLSGLAFGLLFLNSAVAIVVYLVLPNVFSVVAGLWSVLHTVRPWVDLAVSQPKLYGGGAMSGLDWAHLATGTAIWVVLPFVVGLARVLRAEVK